MALAGGATKTVADLLLKGVPLELLRAGRESFVKEQCNELLDGEFRPEHLALLPFSDSEPMRFWSREAAAAMLQLLRASPERSIDALCKESDGITHALGTAMRDRDGLRHEEAVTLDAKGVAMLDHTLHPEYLRAVEHVYKHLLNLVARILDLGNGTSTRGTGEPNKVQHLVEQGLGALTSGYQKTLRNSLSHGRVRFGTTEIHYHDKNETASLHPSGFLAKLDAMVDTNHGIVAAILAFLAEAPTTSDQRKALPLGWVLWQARYNWSYAGFAIEWMTESEALGDKAQLNLNCTCTTPSREVQQLGALTVSALAVSARPAYDRLAFHIAAPKGVAGGFFVDARRLQKALDDMEGINALNEVVETNMLWHEGSAVDRWIYNLQNTFVPIAQATISQVKKDLGLVERRFSIRIAENLSIDGLLRWKVYAVVFPEVSHDEATLASLAQHIANQFRFKLVRDADLSGERGLPRLPHQVIIELRPFDQRRRNLHGSPYGPKRIGKIWTITLRNPPKAPEAVAE